MKRIVIWSSVAALLVACVWVLQWQVPGDVIGGVVEDGVTAARLDTCPVSWT